MLVGQMRLKINKAVCFPPKCQLASEWNQRESIDIDPICSFDHPFVLANRPWERDARSCSYTVLYVYYWCCSLSSNGTFYGTLHRCKDIFIWKSKPVLFVSSVSARLLIFCTCITFGIKPWLMQAEPCMKVKEVTTYFWHSMTAVHCRYLCIYKYKHLIKWDTSAHTHQGARKAATKITPYFPFVLSFTLNPIELFYTDLKHSLLYSARPDLMSCMHLPFSSLFWWHCSVHTVQCVWYPLSCVCKINMDFVCVTEKLC